MTISCPWLAVVQGTTTCYVCKARVPVVAIAAPPEARVDGDYPLGEHGWLGLSELESLPDAIMEEMRAWAPGFRADENFTAGIAYLMNHCGCGAKLGDHYLHSEPDGPFFGMETAGLKANIVDRALVVGASYSEGALAEWLSANVKRD